MKKYYFLSGLHRSGNTLLSTILNQNPKIYSGELSPMAEYMWIMDNSYKNQKMAYLSKDSIGSKNIIKNMFDNYYSHVDKPIIFDRDKNWLHKTNIKNITEYVTKTPKIVVTVRPIIEILTSFVVKYSKTSQPYLEMFESYPMKQHLSEEDNFCDFLMMPNGIVDRIYSCIAYGFHNEDKSTFHIVEYDSLVYNTKNTLSEIYNFIGEDAYDHDFNNLENKNKNSLLELNLPTDLHTIRKTISNQSFKPKDVLSDYIIQKYSNLEFWRG
jgi:sulfotransferase